MPVLQLFLSAILAALAGCELRENKSASKANSAGPVDTSNAADLTPIDIQLNWKPEAEHGGYFAAVVHGYYSEEGLNVTLIPGGPATPLMESVGTNRVRFGVDNADKLLRARAQGVDVVAVFAPIQDSPRCIMVHQESGITKLEDLQRTDGITLAWNSAQPFAQFLMKKMDLSRLQMIKYSGSIGPFLQDKNYAQQAYNISEPFLAKQQGAHPVNLMLSDAGFNTYTSLLLTSGKQITDQPELVRKVVRASQRGWVKYLTEADESNRRIAELNPEMPVEILDYGVKELQKLCRPDDLPSEQIGRMETRRWQTLIEQLVEIQLIEPSAVKAAESFTAEFLPAE